MMFKMRERKNKNKKKVYDKPINRFIYCKIRLKLLNRDKDL